METLPFVTLRMLKPTVGIMSSLNCPVAMTFTSDVLPAAFSPISDSSISSLRAAAAAVVPAQPLRAPALQRMGHTHTQQVNSVLLRA